MIKTLTNDIMSDIVVIEEVAPWLCTGIALIGTVLNAQQNVLGFFFWLVSNTGFVFINLYNGNHAQAVLFFVNDIIAILGILEWNKKAKK